MQPVVVPLDAAYLTPKQAAALLTYSTTAPLQRLVKAGRLTPIRLSRRKVLFKTDQVLGLDQPDNIRKSDVADWDFR